jgi:hypothetical protein
VKELLKIGTLTLTIAPLIFFSSGNNSGIGLSLLFQDTPGPWLFTLI